MEPLDVQREEELFTPPQLIIVITGSSICYSLLASNISLTFKSVCVSCVNVTSLILTCVCFDVKLESMAEIFH